MKKIVCEMCECTEFVKEDGLFVCQDCGCKYSIEDAKKMMREFADEKQTEDCPNSENDCDEKEIPIHTADSPNRIFVEVIKVGHETYTTQSVTSLSVLLGGEPQPVFVEGPDVVGHIGTEISVQNLAGKAIKYATVYLAPFNAVGDQVACTVQGHSVYGIEITGPLVVGQKWEGYSEGMWYNHSIVGATIDHVHVIYMDDTEEIYEGKEFYLSPTDAGTKKRVCMVNVTYSANAGAAQELWYTWDNEGTKNKVFNGQSQKNALSPGKHKFNILNPLMKKTYEIDVTVDKTVYVKGKSFSMQVDF